MLFPNVVNRVASEEINNSQIDTIPPVVIISNSYKISKPVNGKSTIILTGIAMDNTGVSSMLWQTFSSSRNKLSSESGVINYSDSPLANHSTPGNCKWTLLLQISRIILGCKVCMYYYRSQMVKSQLQSQKYCLIG
jgi:hypothetical protein